MKHQLEYVACDWEGCRYKRQLGGKKLIGDIIMEPPLGKHYPDWVSMQILVEHKGKPSTKKEYHLCASHYKELYKLMKHGEADGGKKGKRDEQ
jgi:hypothetical protein